MKPRPIAYVVFIVVLFFLFVLGVQRSEAASANVSWVNPTSNVDGSTIPSYGLPGSLVSTRVEYGTCSGTSFGTKQGEVVANQPSTSVTIPNLAVATTYCFRAFAKNTYGVESSASNVASKSTPAPQPEPPVVTVSTTAWEVNILGSGEVRLGRNVGTVPLGVSCGANVLGNYNILPQGSYKLQRQPKSSIVVGLCS